MAVWVQHRQNTSWEPATVVSHSSSNSYWIMQENGTDQPRVYRRTRTMLKIRCTNVRQTRHSYSQSTESEKAKFQTPFTSNEARNYVEHNSVENISQDLVHPTKSNTASASLISEEREEIECLVKQGILEDVKEHTDWVNSYVIVEKDTGNHHSPNHTVKKKLRICLDPRDLLKIYHRILSTPKSDTASASLISEGREEITETADVPAPAPTLERVKEQSHTPGSKKSTRKNLGRPANSYSDFYM